MSAKMPTVDQHQPLHATYGRDDCCLCRAERERDEARDRVDELRRENNELKQRLQIAYIAETQAQVEVARLRDEARAALAAARALCGEAAEYIYDAQTLARVSHNELSIYGQGCHTVPLETRLREAAKGGEVCG